MFFSVILCTPNPKCFKSIMHVSCMGSRKLDFLVVLRWSSMHFLGPPATGKLSGNPWSPALVTSSTLNNEFHFFSGNFCFIIYVSEQKVLWTWKYWYKCLVCFSFVSLVRSRASGTDNGWMTGSPGSWLVCVQTCRLQPQQSLFLIFSNSSVPGS